jgi:hypothetical protein
MATLTISGLDQLRGELRRLAAEAPRAVAPALTAALKPIADRAADLAPEKTGRLRSSVQVREQAPAGGICLSTVEVPLEYGVHQDLGFERRRGDHFLEQAASQGEAQAVDQVVARIARELGQ